MNPTLKAYLDKLHAETRAQYAEIHKQLQLQEALFSKFDTGASTPQSAGSAVVTSDGGLTDDASVPAVVPDVFTATNQAQETPAVAHDATAVCIEMAPVTCSTECPTQVATTTDLDHKAGVQATTEAFSRPVFPVTSKAYHVVGPSDLAAPTLTMCSMKCSGRDTNPLRYVLHPAATPSGLVLRPKPWPSFWRDHARGTEDHDDSGFSKHVTLLHDSHWLAELCECSSTSAHELHHSCLTTVVVPLFRSVKKLGALSTELSRSVGLQLTQFQPLLSSAPASITMQWQFTCDKRPLQYLMSPIGLLYELMCYRDISSQLVGSEKSNIPVSRPSLDSEKCPAMIVMFTSTSGNAEVQSTAKHLKESVHLLLHDTYVMTHFSSALNSLREALIYLQSVQLKLPWPSFSNTCRAVQVQSELPKSVLEQEHWKFSEHHVVEHAAVGSFPRPDKMLETLQIANMSGQWSFLSLEEFQGSGRFTTDCSSEQCGDPYVLLACLMVQPIGSVHKRGVQTNAVKSKEFKGNICLCFSINLVSLTALIPFARPIFCYEQPFNYLQGAQRQPWRPLDRVTYIAEHARKGSEAMHTEQVNYKGVQSSSCCMVHQLEVAEYFHHCAATYDFYMEKLTLERKLENSGSHNSIVSITTTLVHGMNTCSLGNILVHTWLGFAASSNSCSCSPDSKYSVVIQFLVLLIREIIDNVLKREVQPNAVESRDYKSNKCLSFQIHLFELEQCIVKVSYGIKTGLHPLCVSTSRALLVLLFEWPLSSANEFIAGTMPISIEKLCSAGGKRTDKRRIQVGAPYVLWRTRCMQLAIEGSQECLPCFQPKPPWRHHAPGCTPSRLMIVAGLSPSSVQFDSKDATWTCANSWNCKNCPLELLCYNKVTNSFDARMLQGQEMKLCTTSGDLLLLPNQRWYSLCGDCSCDLTHASGVIWVEYPSDEVHKSLDPGSITMTTSDLQPPKILMVLVISKRAPAMSGTTSSTCYNQDHFQEGRGVITVAAVFAQDIIDHKLYIGFDCDCAENGYFSVAAFIKVSINHNNYFNWVAVGHDYYYLSHDRFSELVQVHLNHGYYRDNYHGDPGMIKDLPAP